MCITPHHITSHHIQAKFRSLEHENADLRFLNTQYAHKCRSLEVELQHQRERIDRLNEKNMLAVVKTTAVCGNCII